MEWGLGQKHGIAVLFRRFDPPGVDTPAVANDEHYRFLCHDGADLATHADGGKR
jgi:hypothetical protein